MFSEYHGSGRASRAGFTLVEIMIVVVIIGLLAAIATPTFVKIRATSQDKTVTSNLRQLLFAADQYYLESGNTTVESAVLVGTNSTQYVKVIETVANESYSTTLTQAAPITATSVAGQRTITYVN
jgi:type IV pilus assembly protein PilA